MSFYKETLILHDCAELLEHPEHILMSHGHDIAGLVHAIESHWYMLLHVGWWRTIVSCWIWLSHRRLICHCERTRMRIHIVLHRPVRFPCRGHSLPVINCFLQPLTLGQQAIALALAKPRLWKFQWLFREYLYQHVQIGIGETSFHAFMIFLQPLNNC